jgi:hypothetical protein
VGIVLIHDLPGFYYYPGMANTLAVSRNPADGDVIYDVANLYTRPDKP